MPEGLIWTEFPELTRPSQAVHKKGTVREFVTSWGPCPPRVPGDKESLPLVSPAGWPEGGRQGSNQPTAMWAVVLDFDWVQTVKDPDTGKRSKRKHEGYLEDGPFVARLLASGIPCLDYLTYSATALWLKRRVVSVLARPVEPSRYAALVRLYARSLGFEREWATGAIDATCAEPKRVYFAAHDERGLDGHAEFSHSIPQMLPSDGVDGESDMDSFVWDWDEQELREVQLELSAADVAVDEDPRAIASTSDEVLASALGFVDPSDREVWFRVGSALKTWALNRDGNAEAGWALWEAWSKRCPEKWDEADARKNWRSFDPGRVSAGTIIHLARAAGWQMNEVDRLNQEFFTVPVQGAIRVARIVPQREVDGWVPQDMPGIQLYSEKAFCARFQEWVPYKGRDDAGQPVEKRKPLGKFWLESPKHRHYPNGFRFDYGSQDHRDGYFNLFQGFAVQPDPLPHPEARCGAILRHALDVICDGDQDCFDYLANWMAWKLQRPGKKLKTAVVVRGLKGTGKDAFFEAFVRIIGTRCAFVLDDTRKFEKTFNSFMADKCLIVMDESNLLGHDVEEKLKHYITQDTVTMEGKGKDAIMVKNHADFIVYGNRDALVNVTADERRYFVLECSDRRRGDVEYFDGYFEELENGGLSAFCAWLLARDLAGFRPSAIPKTTALRQQYLLTQHPGLLALKDWLTVPTFWEVELFQKGTERGGRNAPWVLAREVQTADGWPTGCAVRQQQLAEFLVRVCRSNGTLQRANTPARTRDSLRQVFMKVNADRAARLPLPQAVKDGTGGLQTRPEEVFILPPLADVRRAFEDVAGVRVSWDPIGP